ncbi:MAG TPA: AMP-binding protein [Acidimicrobiales bacterium]|nr:AMP-binding protein [Acidimicrobiales bacterium]
MRALVPAGQWPESARRQTGGTLADRWLAHWRDDPGKVVLVDGSEPERVVDGARLTQRTADAAAVLAGRGVVPGARVVWCARARLDAVEALLAVLRAGAVLVPVNPASTPAEIDHFVRDAGPTVAIADDPAAFGSSVPTLSVAELFDTAPADGAYSPPEVRVSDDALIVYTSGTTGRPKGAVHTHASLLAGIDALQTAWGWRSEDRLILTLPLFHVHGLVAGLFGALTAGATTTVFDRFDENTVLDAASEHTMFFGVPTMYHRLGATDRIRALSKLRLCVSGSAPLAAELWHRFAAQGVEVLERYGMTETLLTLSNPLVGERRAGSVGVPLPGVEAAIDEPDEEGVGELSVRGASLCRGYWRRPDETTTDAAGWFATGDLVSVSDDGYVTIRGRRTELIITGGHNVYPAEVEAVLARHPGVHEVAVVGVPSAEWGETVEAFVVGDPDPESLDDLATRELAPFKRPRQVHIVEALPRNALGKVVRGDLRSRRSQP